MDGPFARPAHRFQTLAGVSGPLLLAALLRFLLGLSLAVLALLALQLELILLVVEQRDLALALGFLGGEALGFLLRGALLAQGFAFGLPFRGAFGRGAGVGDHGIGFELGEHRLFGFLSGRESVAEARLERVVLHCYPDWEKPGL